MEFIKNKISSTRNFWNKKVVLGSLKAMRNFAHNQIRLRDETYGVDQDWKVKIQEDFQSWLMDLSSPMAEDGENGQNSELDLFTLLGEFATLRKEIHLQSREQAKNIKGLKDFNGFVDKTAHLLTLMDEKISRMNAMEIRVQNQAEEKIIRIFLDVRNSLKRGIDSAQKILNARFVWRRKRIKALVQGYEIALDKFDKALAMEETYPIITRGEKFNPDFMRAVDRVTVKGVEPGMVHIEVACGFIRKDRVLLPADVIVTSE